MKIFEGKRLPKAIGRDNEERRSDLLEVFDYRCICCMRGIQTGLF